MGLIKEPKDVDLVIQGRLLTKKEEKIISDFIRKRKEELARRKHLNHRVPRTRKHASRKNKITA